jgi:hypothetical protein
MKESSLQIAALRDGRSGRACRVATLRKELVPDITATLRRSGPLAALVGVDCLDAPPNDLPIFLTIGAANVKKILFL